MSNQVMQSQSPSQRAEGARSRDTDRDLDKASERDTRFESRDFANMVAGEIFRFPSLPNAAPPAKETMPGEASQVRTSENIIYAMNNVRLTQVEGGAVGADAKHLELNALKHMQTAPAGADIRFSVIMPNNQEVDVRAFENPECWRVSMAARDAELKKLIEKSRTNMAESMRRELGKKVLIDVE